MDLDAVADELYALPLGQFTATRDERARQARADGDKALAAAVKALRKPTTAGWLANLLVRERPDEVGPLLELGAALREATASLQGDALRELSAQQQRLVAALVQQARALAAVAGHRVADDAAQGLEATLRAALADPVAAEQLATGRLLDALSPSGFPGLAGAAAPVARPRGGVSRDAPGQDAARRAALERAVREAQARDAAAREAEQRLAEASDALAAARERLDALDEQVRDLGERLERAEQDRRRAESDARQARERREQAERVAADAVRRRDDASRERDRLAAG